MVIMAAETATVTYSGETSKTEESKKERDLRRRLRHQISHDESQTLRTLKTLITGDEFMKGTGILEDWELLLGFVRGKRCNAALAFKALKNYIQTVKVKHPKYFQNLNPMKIKSIQEGKDGLRLGGVLKLMDLEGRRVAVARASAFSPNLHNVDDLIEVLIICSLELLRSENATKHGLVLVVDAAGFGFRHAREFSMSRMYFFLSIFLTVMPIKYKQCHIINNTHLYEALLTIVKQFIPKKLRERIYLHGSNLTSFYKLVPKEILPESFGGVLGDVDAYDKEFEQSIMNHGEFYGKLG